MELELRQLSSLEKVFLDTDAFPPAYRKASALKGERFSYQIAYTAGKGELRKAEAAVCVASPLDRYISLRRVGCVPSELPAYLDVADEDYLRTAPGLFPDPLFPVDGFVDVAPNVWHSLFVTVEIPVDAEAGDYPIVIRFDCGEQQVETLFTLTVIDAVLPPQRLIYTQWFHADCIASVYGLETMSEPHWQMIGRFMRTAAKNGVNLLLTPVFTLALDTAVGGERPTFQLVEVAKQGERYTFRFELLRRWIELARQAGIHRFEISHLFSQWGAKCAPKIVAEENGETKRIFGWETEAASPAYQSFLAQFLPSLVAFLRAEGLEDKAYFHISDEPQGEEHRENYRRAKEMVKPFLDGFPIIDALSEYAFYEEGIVDHPIPSVDHIAPFLENGVPDLWCYYCCAQSSRVSNRFFALPSRRNRIIGAQLYLHGIKGFLQWGFNFYYSSHSRQVINPFLTTDGMAAFPSGDAFGVYPGREGPVEGLSMVVFYEALQDMRAMQLLESLAGREKVEELLSNGAGGEITFTDYPRDDGYLLTMREAVNREIAARQAQRT